MQWTAKQDDGSFKWLVRLSENHPSSDSIVSCGQTVVLFGATLASIPRAIINFYLADNNTLVIHQTTSLQSKNSEIMCCK